MHIGEQEIHYRERGAGEALLIFPDDIHAAAAYEAEMAHLADGFRVLAFDVPGTGGSTRDLRYLDEREFPVLLTGSLQDDVTPGIAAAYGRMAGVVPDCSVFLESTAHHRPGEEHPLMWADPEAFRSVVDRFLARVS